MFNKLRIGKKFIFCFGVMIFLMFSLTIATLYSYSSITRTTNEVVHGIKESKHANDMIDATNLMRHHFFLYLATRDASLIANMNKNIKETEEKANDVLKKTQFDNNRTEAKQVLDCTIEIESNRKDFVEYDEKLTALNKAYHEQAGQLNHLFDELYDLVHFNSGKNENKNGNQEENAKADNSKLEFEKAIMVCSTMVDTRVVERLKFANCYTDEERKKAESKIKELGDKFDAAFNKISQFIMEGETKKKHEEIHQWIQTWYNTANEHTNTVKILTKNQENMIAKFQQIIDVCSKMLKRTAAETEQDVQLQNSVIMFSKKAAYVTAFAAFVIAVGLGFLLTRSVAGSITGIVNLFKQITKEGDTEVVIDEKYLRRGDEIGDLAEQAKEIINDYHVIAEMGQSTSRGDWTYRVKIKSKKDEMNKNLFMMFEQVNEILNQVKNSVQQVTSGAGQVAASSESLSQGSTQSAASLEEITSSMTEMGSQTHKNAENAGEASHLAKNTSEAAGVGQSMMKQMINSMEQITKNSHDVQSVIKVIDDISFQTNLLALNAAVEAARAGVHGKGFAVVAEEVRNLAARCAKAAGETTQMIENNNRQIHEGAEIAQKTSEMLDQIVLHASNSTKLILEIAAANNEQAQGISQVTQALQQIDAVTQANTASAEESASASSEMNSQAVKLQQMVARFKLRNMKIGGTSGENSADHSAVGESEKNFSYGETFSSNNRANSGVKKAAKSGGSHYETGWESGAATAVLDADFDNREFTN
ncbi:MAG: methyl-accepting chemotaxis protein [Planctomycetaceae bacterium]|jgi:methyl-accepting chemotaxis protein|nr:methyl-accepting chemotaxis protein [Planctomycetaceae bacterium]